MVRLAHALMRAILDNLVMRQRLLLLVVAMTAVSGLGGVCADPEPVSQERTVDVEALTVEELQRRALAAIHQPGKVYHAVQTVWSARSEIESDVWVDAEQEAARQEWRDLDDEIRIRLKYDGRLLVGGDRGATDAPCWPCREDMYATFAAHLDWILETGYKQYSIEKGTDKGAQTIVVRITRPLGGDTPGDATATIELDELFLPLAIHVEPPAPFPASDTRFEHEFVEQGDPPPDFFLPESLGIHVIEPRQHVQNAADAGLDVYWLGETFEGLELRQFTQFVPGDEPGTGVAELHLDYAPPPKMGGPPCIRISVRDSSVFRPQRLPPAAEPFAHVPVGDETATIYRAYQEPLAPPSAGDRQGQVLTPVPADDGHIYAASFETDRSVIDVTSDCGPAGSNVYRTEEGFRRIMAALTRYG